MTALPVVDQSTAISVKGTVTLSNEERDKAAAGEY
jgi:hypothetical protein